jgi:glycosyltransferase involved in cell wall biosynthesis
VASLLPALVEGFDVTVAASGTGPLEDSARTCGVTFVRLRHVTRPLRPLRDLLGLVELVALMRRTRPHIVHASSAKAAALGRVAAAIAGVPIRVYTVHGWSFLAETGMTARAYRRIERVLARLTTTTICVSENERRAGLAERACVAASTVVIRNGVDIVSPRAPPSPNDPARLISVARLQAPKDPITLVRAIGMLRDASCSLVLVGDGPEHEHVDSEVRRLGLAGVVELTGNRPDVAELLAGSDIFVLSSNSEGLPLSILEAMAVGLPVVASRVGGIPEVVVDEETGLLVPPGSPGALAAALRRLIGDRDLRRRLGAAGRSRVVRDFDLGSVRRDHVVLYRAELARRGLPTPSP